MFVERLNTKEVRQTQRYKCKECGFECDQDFEAFQHNLSHGRLAMNRMDFLTHFEVKEIQWLPYTEARQFELLEKSAKAFYEGHSPFDPKFIRDNDVHPTELFMLKTALAAGIELCCANREQFRRFVAEKACELLFPKRNKT